MRCNNCRFWDLYIKGGYAMGGAFAIAIPLALTAMEPPAWPRASETRRPVRHMMSAAVLN